MNETTTQPDILVGSITKDSKREIRVEIRTVEGHRSIDIRLWSSGSTWSDVPRDRQVRPLRATPRGRPVARGAVPGV